MQKLILASASARRRELLRKLDVPFTVIASNYKENMALRMPPERLARHLSEGKAAEVASRRKNGIVIGADTFVVLGQQRLGKPHTAANAKKMLRMLSGKTHKVITGFTIIDARSGKKTSKSVTTKVTFKKLSANEIAGYVKKERPLEFAGSYCIQQLGWTLVKSINGDYFNIVGLPLQALQHELKKFGVGAH